MGVLDSMSQQEIFNKVSEHLLKQGAKSILDGKCKYRHGDLRCAVGALIPNEAYAPEMEGRNLYEGIFTPTLGADLDKLHLLEELRRIHDREDVEEWPRCLKEVAGVYSLEWVYG